MKGWSRVAGMKSRAKPLSPQQQLERELRKACGWLRELKEMCLEVFPSTPCQPYVTLLMKNYRELVLAGEFNESIAQSIKRVIDACDVNKQLLDFAPSLLNVIVRIREAARTGEEDERKEITRVAELLEKMKLHEFLKNWAGIAETLEFYEYYDELMDIYDAIAFNSLLMKVLEEEIRKVAVTRGLNMRDVLNRLEY